MLRKQMSAKQWIMFVLATVGLNAEDVLKSWQNYK